MSIDSLTSGISSFISTFSTIIAVVSLIIGLLQCFFGYKFLKFWTALIGFILGVLLGFLITSNLDVSQTIRIIIIIVSGLIIGSAAFFLYKVGVFILVGLCAAVLSVLGMEALKASTVLTLIVAVVIFILFGILGVKFQKPIIIVITAVSGATGAASSLEQLVPSFSKYTFIVLALLAAAGIILQLMTNKTKAPRRHR